MAGRAFIYALIEPSTGAVRYVGKAQDWRRRYGQHCTFANNRSDTARCAWLRSLIESGLKPGIQILEDAADWDMAERKWIRHFRAVGADLVNGNEGGQCGGDFAKSQAKSIWGKLKTPLQIMLCQIKADIRPTGLIARYHPEARARMKQNADAMDLMLHRLRKLNGGAWMDWVNVQMVMREPQRFPEHIEALRAWAFADG